VEGGVSNAPSPMLVFSLLAGGMSFGSMVTLGHWYTAAAVGLVILMQLVGLWRTR